MTELLLVDQGYLEFLLKLLETCLQLLISLDNVIEVLIQQGAHLLLLRFRPASLARELARLVAAVRPQ